MTTKVKKSTCKKAVKKTINGNGSARKPIKTTIVETPVKRGPGRPRKVVTEVIEKPKVINIIPTITVNTIDGRRNIRFTIPGDKSGNSGYVYACDAPTGSCQLFSVAYFQNIKWLENQAKIIFKTKPFKIDYRPLITAIRRSTYTKNLMFIDVKSTLTPFIKELFTKDQIISETPYKSTNSSSMVLYTIDVREFL